MKEAEKKRNILVFSHSSLLGGAERSMLDLIDTLSSRGFRVAVVLPGRGPMEKALRQKSIPFFVVRYWWWATAERENVDKYSKSMNNLLLSLPRLSKFKPDCIITNTAVIPWGMLAAKFLNVPHIWNVREFVVKDHSLIPDITFPELAKTIYAGSEKIWFVSNAVRQEFEKYIPDDRSEVIYSRINIPELLIREKVKSPYKYERSFKLIMPSHIYPTKGQDQAVKAVRVLIDKKYNVELLLIGPGARMSSGYLRKLIKVAGALYKDRIHILSFVENPYPYILMSDVVLVCSKSEAFSRTLIESGYLGKTFIASRSGGNVEIGEDNGLFYEYNDAAGLAEKIRYLIENHEVYEKFCTSFQERVREKFVNNSVFTDTIPNQLQNLGRGNEFMNSFDLIRRILQDSYQNSQRLKIELASIKSSKNYRLWDKYGKIKKKFGIDLKK